MHPDPLITTWPVSAPDCTSEVCGLGSAASYSSIEYHLLLALLVYTVEHTQKSDFDLLVTGAGQLGRQIC